MTAESTETGFDSERAKNLTDKEAQIFLDFVYRLSFVDLPSDDALNKDNLNKIRNHIKNIGLLDDVRAYAHEEHRNNHLAQLFFQDVLSGILDTESLEIDEDKFKKRLIQYKKVIGDKTIKARLLAGRNENLDYVARLNARLDIPRDYTLTENDVGYFLKHVFSTDKFPAKIKKDVYVTSYAELSDREHTQKLRTVLQEAINNCDSPCSIYVPLNLSGYHWVYLAVELDREGKLDFLACVDSLDTNDEYKEKLKEKLFDELGAIDGLEFTNDFEEDGINFEGAQKQKDNFSCGYRMLRGILGEAKVDNERAKKVTGAKLEPDNVTDLQRAVFDAIEAEATKAKKLLPSDKRGAKNKNSRFFDPKKTETQVKVKISEEVVKNIKDHLLNDDKFKPLNENENFKNWPVRLEYTSSEEDAEPCRVVINQEKEGGEDYLTFKTYVSDLDTNKAVIDKAVAMGLKTLQISGDEKVVKELEKYCQDKHSDVIIEPSSPSVSGSTRYLSRARTQYGDAA